MPPFDEDSRVKIPALVHFTRIGYEYLSKKEMGKRSSILILQEISSLINSRKHKCY